MREAEPIVAIVGRPNVGKSTLFNRLIGSRRAIVADAPGTTRDRIYGEAEWQGSQFTVVDTGGLTRGKESLTGAVNDQVETAVKESDLVLLVVSAKDGLLGEDKEIANWVRKKAKQVILVANKVDGPARDVSEEFEGIGFDVVPISALHGKSTGDLADRIIEKVGKAANEHEPATPSFTIVGRPNAGKSTLVNQLSGSISAVTDEVPHTTRDVTERMLQIGGQNWRLVDTAGMVRKSRRAPGIPYWSLLRTLRAIAQGDVAVLLIDAEEGPTLQDAHIASYILDSGTGLVLAVNKWDLVKKSPEIQEKFFAKLRKRLPFAPAPPVVFVSALTGEKLDRLTRAVSDVYEASRTRVGTSELNKLVQTRLSEYAGGRKKARLYYLTQTGTLPPTFVIFVNQPTLWGEDQRKHLAGALREEFGLYGAAIRLEFRKSKAKEREAA